MLSLKESSFYQVLVEEGRKEGRKEGEKQGQIKGAQELLFHLGLSRLGPIPKKARVAIASVRELGRLEQLAERLLVVSSWAELLAELE